MTQNTNSRNSEHSGFQNPHHSWKSKYKNTYIFRYTLYEKKKHQDCKEYRDSSDSLNCLKKKQQYGQGKAI